MIRDLIHEREQRSDEALIITHHEMSPCVRFAHLVDMTGQLRKKRGREAE
jgi:hypothetical protein